MAEVTILPRLPMTKRLLAVLREQTGKPWEISTVPRKPDPQKPAELIGEAPPYGILYPMWERPDEDTGPPLTAPNADPSWVYQASYYSIRGDQLEWLRDRVYAVLLGRDSDGKFLHSLDLDAVTAGPDGDHHPGIYVMDRELVEEQGMPNPTGTLLEASVRVALKVTPRT